MRSWLAVLVVVITACRKPEPPIARLETIVAQVERLPGAGEPWLAGKIGDTFVIGGAVRTGPTSKARLILGANGTLDVDANAVVYFRRTPGRAGPRSGVHVEAGSVELEAGDAPLAIGDAVLEARGRARVSNTEEGLRIDVTFGRVVLEAKGTSAEAGSTITIARAEAPTTAKVVAGREPVPGDAAVAAVVISIEVTGKPARSTGPSGPASLAPGKHRVEPGTEIEVPAGATVEVVGGGAHAVVSGAATLRIGGVDGALVTMTKGGLVLRGETAGAVAAVPGGRVAVQSGGADARVVVRDTGTDVEAQLGETVVTGAKGDETLTGGEIAVLAPDGTITVATRPPETALVTVAAGESPVIHGAQVPTVVHFDVGTACKGAAAVELARDRSFKRVIARGGSRGRGARLMVPAGAFVYRVRCDRAGGQGASGTIRVTRDTGRAPLPTTAAQTLVEMDGREYTILYQNLLPALTLAWRTAPAKANYQFIVKPKRGPDRRFPSATPKLSLRAGELREGSYTVWVENATGGGRSEQVRIVIEFDNAAASASIDSVEVEDGKVRVKGAVIEGSTVTFGGAAVTLDRQRRFVAETAPKPGEDGVGLRIAHPKLGVHYYVLGVAAPGGR